MKNKKLIFATTFAISMMAGAMSASAAEYNLIAAHVSSEEHSFQKGFEAFQEAVDELSEGRISVEIHANGELGGNEDELVQKMATGTVDMIISAPSFLAQSVRAADMLSLPYLFSSLEQWEAAMDGEPGQEIAGYVEENGLFKVLGYFCDGVRSMYTVNPVESVEDMKDLKFRIQNSETQTAFWSALGVQPTSIAFSEIYQALQNGVIDGAENSCSQIVQQKHYEICKNITLTEHDIATRFFLISQSKYKSLPEDLQAVVDEAAAIAVKAQREADFAMDKEYKEILKDAGVNFIEIDKQPLIDMTEEVRTSIVEKLGLTEMYETIQGM